MSYKAIIGKLTNVRPHSNADKIKLATVYGSQVVIGLDNFEGQLGIYFPTDGKLSEEFCKANNLLEIKDENGVKIGGGYFNEKRRIKCQKFRGEKSEGFWIPIESLKFTGYNLEKLSEGVQLDELAGIKICEKYFTPATKGSGGGNKTKKKKKSNFKFFKEHYDTAQLAYYIDKIPKGSIIYISEKCHGTSARTGYLQEELNLNFSKRIINKIFPIFETEKWNIITGTRRVVLNDFNDVKKLGFYGSNEFRKKFHDKFLNTLWKGEICYYEICGWVSQDKPVMAIGDTKKLKDKELISKYGERMVFKYGCLPGTAREFVYRFTMTNIDGQLIEFPWFLIKSRCKFIGLELVPELVEPFVYDGNKDKLMSIVESVYDGESIVDSSHIKEGICLRYEHESGIDVFKHKNFSFKCIENLVKEDDGVIDIEEQQDLIKEEQK